MTWFSSGGVVSVVVVVVEIDATVGSTTAGAGVAVVVAERSGIDNDETGFR